MKARSLLKSGRYHQTDRMQCDCFHLLSIILTRIWVYKQFIQNGESMINKGNGQLTIHIPPPPKKTNKLLILPKKKKAKRKRRYILHCFFFVILNMTIGDYSFADFVGLLMWKSSPIAIHICNQSEQLTRWSFQSNTAMESMIVGFFYQQNWCAHLANTFEKHSHVKHSWQ